MKERGTRNTEHGTSHAAAFRLPCSSFRVPRSVFCMSEEY
jgi:hypothetical protein